MIRLLLERDDDVHQDDDLTIFRAVARGREEAVDLLLGHGAKPDRRLPMAIGRRCLTTVQ